LFPIQNFHHNHPIRSRTDARGRQSTTRRLGASNVVARAVMFRAAMTSASVMAAGDVLCQAVAPRAAVSSSVHDSRARAVDDDASTSYRAVTRRTLGFEHDAERTGRFFVVGAGVHGPMFHHAFRQLDRVVGAGTCAKTVVKKVAIGHTVLFPTYTAMFFFAMSGLEGETVTRAYERFRDRATETFVSGTAYWPFVNAFNFAYVPRAGRLLFLNACGVCWNAYMSHVVSSSSSSSSELAEEGGDAGKVFAASSRGE